MVILKVEMELFRPTALLYKFYGRDMVGIYFFSILPVVSR